MAEDRLGGWVSGDGKWCSSAAREGEIKEALEHRRQFLGPSFSTHYANPIVVRRGKGAVLFDDRNQAHILKHVLYSAFILAFQMLPQGLIALVNKFSKVRSAVAVY